MEKSEVSLFTQILLATQTIAYLSNRITEVNDQMKMVLDSLNQEEHTTQIIVISESIRNKENMLTDNLISLQHIIQELADYINESDIVDDNDGKYTRGIFPLIGL